MGLGADKALKQFLQNKPGGDYGVASVKCGDERLHLWCR